LSKGVMVITAEKCCKFAETDECCYR